MWPKDSKNLKNHEYSSFQPVVNPEDQLTFAFFYDKSIDYQKKYLLGGLFIRNIIVTISMKGVASILIDPIFFEN